MLLKYWDIIKTVLGGFVKGLALLFVYNKGKRTAENKVLKERVQEVAKNEEISESIDKLSNSAVSDKLRSKYTRK